MRRIALVSPLPSTFAAALAAAARHPSRLPGGVLVIFLLGLASAEANAAITITDSTNIVLAASQTESGGDTSDNPLVTSPTVLTRVHYDESGSFTCCGTQYDGTNLNDLDVSGFPSDGTYAIPDDSVPLVLDFGSAQTIASIAIYNGYTNRDSAIYTLRDDASNLLGAWSISTPASSGTNDGADSFWLTFKTPVTTSSIEIEATSFDVDNTVSYREIEVFRPQVVEVDLHSPGDQLVVRDTVSGLDWLKFAHIHTVTGTSTPTYNQVIAALPSIPGGPWRYAVTSEVQELYELRTYNRETGCRPTEVRMIGTGQALGAFNNMLCGGLSGCAEAPLGPRGIFDDGDATKLGFAFVHMIQLCPTTCSFSPSVSEDALWSRSGQSMYCPATLMHWNPNTPEAGHYLVRFSAQPVPTMSAFSWMILGAALLAVALLIRRGHGGWMSRVQERAPGTRV
jgi:hypothetical protein